MKIICSLVLGLFAAQAHALGGIKNGVYFGPLKCSSPSHHHDSLNEITVTVGEHSIALGPEKKDFLIDDHGYLKVTAPNGSGKGYITSKGLHYDITLNIKGKDLHGEDTYLYSFHKVYLISSVKIADELVKCEGVFRKK